MTTKHPHRELLIAIANGKDVEYCNHDKTWKIISPYHALSSIVIGEAQRLRVKPKTSNKLCP